MFSVQRFFSRPKRWPCQHINPKLFSRSSFAGRAVILEPLLGELFFVALSRFWAADLQKLVVFYDFQFARATLCGLWAGRPSKTRGFLRFSNCPPDPLRTLVPSADFGLSALENSWFFAIFKSLARPSAEFRVVEWLPLWRGAHFLEAANPKPLPSQWDLLQSVLGASSKSWPMHWNCC